MKDKLHDFRKHHQIIKDSKLKNDLIQKEVDREINDKDFESIYLNDLKFKNEKLLNHQKWNERMDKISLTTKP